MKEFIKKNIKVIILLITIISLGVIGYTLAVSSKTINIEIASGNYSVIYTGSSTISATALEPIYDSNLLSNSSNSKIVKIPFTIKGASSNPSNKAIIYDVSLTDLNLPDEFHSELLKWRLYKSDTVLSEGSFSYDFDSQVNNRMVLTNIQQDLPSYNSTADSYVFYIWISEQCTGNVTTCTEAQDTSIFYNKSFSGKLKIELSTENKKTLVRPTGIQPNSPDLVTGLIPIVYQSTTDSNGNVTTKILKADSTNRNFSWYNYNNKQWANAVLVSSTNRSTYQSAKVGTEIPMDDILAFYVWIPRYKYKVWNINKQAGAESTYAYNAKTNGINIVFEKEKTSTGRITCSYNYNVDSDNIGIDLSTTTAETCIGSNGDYYTHPAFCLGETTNGVCSGDQLRGFWIGKFELSSSNPSASYGGGNSISLTPRVLPNVTSWRNNYISKFNTVIQNMTASSNIYGLNASTTSSHMLTNMEWGAVAYLTNSKYGKCSVGTNNNTTCTEVAKNSYGSTSNYTTMTGCGPISSGSTSYGTTCNAYDTTLGMSASTTGNITGVYDMSGGAMEYVMGNMSSSTTGYTFYTSSSNFSSSWYTNTTSKFLTTYAKDGSNYNNQTAYNRGRLGDATAETLLSASSTGGWHSDYANFPYSSTAWFGRGGIFNDDDNAGMFFFKFSNGINSTNSSARSTLSALNIS